ncbi:uncharacterized protein LOC107273847 [Cephus cinctus]|uniref:Uncharacterized protein LOC107273847 n=1 Tax=Cephus cinctus TaxID=211228 RepID=A0AAJ7CE36_CEPCN|nr:uncharacterized protein LOC107273847 [Cephus cinctus]XP_015607905.1 uncharacterized protein LOC107273847 [Cephus cinctus]XP_015607906.1 uncharacterized protein LOC107273847 [Cephus cinctus]XP_015607907.1 uncharacterized protein LOC107273847 [Cephus cinctus]XP_024946881.1 uncharacterized protein LOC107273847 [Cephus cinctus]
MPPALRAILVPMLLLMIATSSGAFNSRQTECTFPVRWEGSWFQSGFHQSIRISRSNLSTKGKCLHNEGDKYLVVDEEKSCYRCVVIHEKHSNVLQYKETYCHGRNSLSSLCSYITGDALLYSMFREEAPAVPCPFLGPMTFSYNRGHGTCSSPQSNVDTCTDDSRLLFRYQACPDVPASESAVEELECLATWKEGSSRYLVGRLHHRHASSNEDRYRCFVYERAGQSIGALNRAALGIGGPMEQDVPPPGGPIPEGAQETYRVAQSGDATCNGLFSPMEGSRTMTLRKAASPGKCRFPSWLSGHGSGGLTWHTLDLARSYTFHAKNASLHVTRSNGSLSRNENSAIDFQDVPGQDEQDVKILCNGIKQTNSGQTVIMLVAHFTVGCRSGFTCMTFYRRDGHVIEVQTGKSVSRPEEACNPPHYLPHSIPYLTLVTSSPEPRQCPYLGKFTVTGMNRNQRNTRENRRIKEKVRHAQDRSDDRYNRKIEFELEARRANNEYLIRDHRGRKARSSKSASSSTGDSNNSARGASFGMDHDQRKSTVRRRKHVDNKRHDPLETNSRSRRSPKLEDFQVDMDDFSHVRQFWASRLADADAGGSAVDVQQEDDYFGEYDVDEMVPKKRADHHGLFLATYRDLLRIRKHVDDEEAPTNDNSNNSEDDQEDVDEYLERREKREEEDSRCASDVTTLTVGCSTADRMEFQSDCLDDDDAITAYSCHGRWFDAEGTQFVIATPLARRTSWSNENNNNDNNNNRAQPFRNSRRLCFMYRESGGVVSLTASPVACQRGIPPPPPMLAFNATSTGQCLEENGALVHRASHFITSFLLVITIAVFR